MSYSHNGSNEAMETRNRSRDVADSGVCTRCMADCQGNCDVFKASFRGREVIYPGPFGEMTAGSDKQYPVDYSHLNILGFAQGAKGLDDANSDTAIFPAADTTTVYGHQHPVHMRMPIFTGALGSTDIARKYWECFAIGAAISGISLVVGENVCGIDPRAEFYKDGRIKRSPEMERRIRIYKEWQEEYGDIIVQLNVEDTSFGVAEYVVEKLGVETIELKWGQGAKCIGGEIKIRDLDRALDLQERGYIVTPVPSKPAVRSAYEAGAIKEFERHSRVGFIDEERFFAQVEHLRRNVGAKRISLKTGGYALPELARAIKWSSKARLDLVTIDGSGGGTGMSPWRMMAEWGVPTFHLQALAYECAQRLASRGEWVPDLAMGGGFSTEDHVFKVLAMGAPYFKAVCMGRALMIPGFVGSNIGGVVGQGGHVGLWNELPTPVKRFGQTPEEIFVTYSTLKEKYGAEMDRIPLGSVAVYTFVDKLRTGLRQFMAGARDFRIDTISRSDLIALSEDAAKVSGIQYVMDAFKEDALAVLDS